MNRISFTIITAVLFMILGYGCSENTHKNDIYTIDIDHNKIISKPFCDISFALTDDLEIIPLESNSNALLSYSSKFYIKDGDIYFTGQDMTEGAIYRFDSKGKFLNTIGKAGRGPGELAFSGNLSFINDSIFFYDHFNQKCLIYGKDGIGYREISFSSHNDSIVNLPIEKFLFAGNKMAILTYPDEASHSFMTCDIYTNKIEHFLPIDSIYAKYAWGDDDDMVTHNGNIYFGLWNNDTLYRYDGVCVKPYIHFNVTNKTPDEIMKLGVIEYLKYTKNNSTTGIPTITGIADNYIMGKYNHGEFVYTFIHDIHNNTTLSAGGSLKIFNDGGLQVMGRDIIYQNKLYWACSPMALKVNIASMLKAGRFTNPTTREKLEKLLSTISDEDNPVIFVKEFKKLF